MTDDPRAQAPEPAPATPPEQPNTPMPGETPRPPETPQPAAGSEASLERPKSGEPKAKPKPAAPRAAKAASPKPAIQRKAEPAAKKPAKAQAAPKADQPARAVQRKAAPKTEKTAPPRPPAPPTIQAAPQPPVLQQKPEPPVEKPSASKPTLPKPVAPVQRQPEPQAHQPAPAPIPERLELDTKLKPQPKSPETAGPVAHPAAPVAAPAAPTMAATPSPAAQRQAEPAQPPQAPLELLGRRMMGRLQRTEQALSPWTQQTLRLQRPEPPAPAETGEAAPESEPTRVTGRLGSLAARAQRQEAYGARGTFGALAGGVERAERFAGRITSHFPAIAAKYEQPAEPESSQGQPPAQAAQNFTYYPEGTTGSSSRSQPTMTAAEVLQRFGGGTATTPPPSAPRPTTAPAQPLKPAMPPAQSQVPRDPRRVRRFSKIEEMPQPGEARPEQVAPKPAAPSPAPEPPRIQRRPEPQRPTPRPAVASAQPPAKPETLRAEEPRRRRSHFEEVGSAEAAQRALDEAAKPPEPSKPAAGPQTEQPGPMRWDHLDNIPPSLQRQLEQIQQRLAEQAGQTTPPPVSSEARPFHPRNPNPPPPHPPETPRQRRERGDREPGRGETAAPIAFGPDLQPLPTGVQRQPAPVPAPPEPTATTQTAAVEPQEVPMQELGPALTTQPGVALGLERTEAEADLLAEPAAAMPIIQRKAEEPGAFETSLSELEMPFVMPLEATPAETEPESAAPAEATISLQPPVEPAPLAAPLAAPFAATVQRLPESDQPEAVKPAASIEDEMTVRIPSAPVAQRKPAEPGRLPAAPQTPADLPSPERPQQPVATGPTPPAQDEARPSLVEFRPATPARTPEPLVLRQPAHSPETEPESADSGAPLEAAAEFTVPEMATPPVVQRSPITESPADQPLVLRQPAPEPVDLSASSERTEPAEPTAPAESETAMDEPGLRTPPELQRSPALPTQAEQPLIVREPPPEAPSAPEAAPATNDRPAAIQRRPAQTAPATLAPTTPAPTKVAAPLPPPVEPSIPVRSENEAPTFGEAQRPAPGAEVQPSALEGSAQPLTLREPEPTDVPGELREPAALVQAAMEPPASPAAGAPPVGLQRELMSNEALPLRTAPLAPAETDPVVEAPASEQRAPGSPLVQRQSDLNIPQQPMPLRPPAEPPSAEPGPTISRPAVPSAAIQRQTEPVTIPPPTPGPTLDMPLRQQATAPEPGLVVGQAQRTATTVTQPPLSLGSQVYARGMKDAGMPVVQSLATNVRRSVQRQPAAPGTTQAQLEPQFGLGLARSASANTPVLPQARMQTAFEAAAAGAPYLSLPGGEASAPSGTLPLAPPGPAPEKPAKTPAVAHMQTGPATSIQRLPLAPVIQREGEDGSGNSSSEDTDERMDEELDRLLKGVKGRSGSSTTTGAGDEPPDLDDLAAQLVPYVKRLLAIEKERQDPTF